MTFTLSPLTCIYPITFSTASGSSHTFYSYCWFHLSSQYGYPKKSPYGWCWFPHQSHHGTYPVPSLIFFLSAILFLLPQLPMIWVMYLGKRTHLTPPINPCFPHVDVYIISYPINSPAPSMGGAPLAPCTTIYFMVSIYCTLTLLPTPVI